MGAILYSIFGAFGGKLAAMRAPVFVAFVALSVVLVPACKASDPPPQSQRELSTSAAAVSAAVSAASAVAPASRHTPSAAAEAEPPPSFEDVELALKGSGYRGGTPQRAANPPLFDLENITGPDGRVASVRVIPRRPAPDAIEADLRSRGALMVARQGGVWLVVLVQRGGVTDAGEMSQLLEAVIEGAGKAPRPAVVGPPPASSAKSAKEPAKPDARAQPR